MSDASIPALKTPMLAKAETPFRRFVGEFARSKLAVVGLVVLLILVFAAVFASWISPQDPYDLGVIDIMESKQPPGSPASDGSMTYWLGTDGAGRDLLSAILYGLRISLSIGAGSAIIACVVGTVLGLIAAYAGGKTDGIIMRIVDLQLSFPSILVALMILATLGKGVTNVLIALIIVEWAYYARTVRGSALIERKREYIEAAECLALPKTRILFRHLLPNCLPPLLVIATQQIARAITLEATLSFLGVGVPITEPSLGLLIKNGADYIQSGVDWIIIYPGVTLVAAIVSLTLVSDQLRDVLNPRLSK
jgi:peptide/nickel transport system permease protein